MQQSIVKFIALSYRQLSYRIVSAVKRVEFVSDRVSYIVLRVRWCNIIVKHFVGIIDMGT